MKACSSRAGFFFLLAVGAASMAMAGDPPCAAVVRIACGPSARQIVRTETRTVLLTPKDIPAIKRAYDEFQPLKHLQTALIEDHFERRPNVFVTRYDNGEEVVCDYAAARYEIFVNNNNSKKGNEK